ncbi:NTP transferase domain-containing protein [Psychrobacter sp. A3]|uniref:molybdenum cofactor guanylyltransferase n=1 Tax=Psychrobacter sp. A3 TaxID=2992754 RepID=UPI00237A3976|nr:NTP transferase domain-containing protein [Psychrobacter sp. A3]MDE0492045.1 NTP transferase domain-containing protein [Psychrobacter sp. A3]
MTDVIKDSAHLVGVVILAGGASTRMGAAKAQLRLPTGERLLDYHVRHTLNLATFDTGNNKSIPIMIADNGRGFDVDSALKNSNPQAAIMHIADYASADSQDKNQNEKVDKRIDDKIKTSGALVAIESALQTVIKAQSLNALTENQSLWLLVISCDSLITATELWQKLQPIATQITKNQAADKKVICLADDSHLYPLLGLYPLSLEPDLKVYIDNGGRRVMAFLQPMAQAVSFPNSWQYLTNFNTPTDFERACHAIR